MMLRQCCQCKRVWIDGQWVYPRLYQLQGREISHGYCEDCFQRTIQTIHAQRLGDSARGWRRLWRGVQRMLHRSA